MSKKKITCHVVSHTHWDRSWYHPFEVFRLRLVRMMDHLLQTLENPRFRHFVFDGQMIPLEDFLEIRPGKRKLIEKYVRNGKLIIGPAYILPDEYLISPESHVRNLLIGHRMASSFGTVQKVGYYPDAFGHVSQMPQILNGFGIDTFLFMRGAGREGDLLDLEFWWDAPGNNGRVLAIHEAGSYSNARMLGIPFCEHELYPADYEKALEKVESAVAHLRKYTKARVLLLNNGFDHIFAQADIPDIIDYINDRSGNLELLHSDFAGYLEEVKKDRSGRFKKYHGELHSGRYNWILTGTISSRMYLKQRNFQSSSLIERGTEPLSSLAWLLGADYPRAFLDYTWKTLLKNHPHDDICGCSVDEVHQDMVSRFDHVDQVCRGLNKEALDFIMSAVSFREIGVPLLVLNTRPVKRSGEVEADIVIPHDPYRGKDLELVDFSGRSRPSRIVRGKPYKNEKFWGRTEVEDVHVSFMADDLPPFGYRSYFLKEKERGAPDALPGVRAGKNFLENEYLKVTIDRSGALHVKDRVTGYKIKNINYLEDCADAGDEYDYSHIKGDRTVNTKGVTADIKTTIIGGYKAVAEISFTWFLPESLSKDRKKRSGKKVALPVRIELTLRSGQRRLEFRTSIHNQARDHRMRAVLPTGIKTDRVSVESKFDVIERPLRPEPAPDWFQPPANTNHQENFASVSDGKFGVSFLNRGLPEYEVEPGRSGAIYQLTLFRSVGWLSRGDLLTRRDNCGPSMETPEAQCIGDHVFEYALILHSGDWENAGIQLDAYDYNTPLFPCSFYHQVRSWKGEPRAPGEASFLKISPEGLVVTGLKKAEERDSLIIRLYNPYSRKISARLDFAMDLKEAWLVRLDESREAPLHIRKRHIVPFGIKPKQIVTVEAVLG